MEHADIGSAGGVGGAAGAGARGIDLHPPADVRRIARVLEQSGYEIWAVGGAVRDALRGEQIGRAHV